MPTILPYGAWPSPITAELITGTPGRAGQPLARRRDLVYWTESRPLEGGRVTLLRRDPDGSRRPS